MFAATRDGPAIGEGHKRVHPEFYPSATGPTASTILKRFPGHNNKRKIYSKQRSGVVLTIREVEEPEGQQIFQSSRG